MESVTRQARVGNHLARMIGEILTNPQRGAEIGVMRGQSSAALLRAFPKLRLYLVDSWQKHAKGGDYWRSGDRCARLSQDEQDDNALAARQCTEFAAERRTILRMPSTAAAGQVPDDALDFAFLDGDHTYAAVRADVAAWWPKVRTDGLLCGHDYGHPRDRRGIWGVSRAVNEFAEKLGLEVKLGAKTIWWVHKP